MQMSRLVGLSDPPAATTALRRPHGRTIDSRRMWRTLGWACSHQAGNENEGGCQTDPSPIFISMMPSVRHQAPSLPTFIHPFPFSRSSETPLLNSLKAGGRTSGQPLAVVMAWPVDDAPRVEIERKARLDPHL